MRQARSRRQVFTEDDLRPAGVTTVRAPKPGGRFVRSADRLEDAVTASFPGGDPPGYP